jgi:hypothetical protein
MKKKLFDEAVNTTADWLIQTNIKLIENENDENYSECAIIKLAIDNFIKTTADIYQKFYLLNYKVEEIEAEIRKENDYIFKQIKEDRELHLND